MHGSLPSEVGLLSDVEQELLEDNAFNAQIPIEIAQWPRVRTIEFKDHSFTGSIPEARLELLESFDIAGNSLNTTFPTVLFAGLTNLMTLSFSNNELGPTIPKDLFTLGKLQDLSLEKASLHGELPMQLGNLTSLTQLVLSDNPNIKGPLPTQVGRLKLLRYLHLDGSMTLEDTSTLPTELGSLENLELLSFIKCSLAGSIPTEIGNLSKLHYMFLNGNSLVGPILVSET